MLHLRIRQGVIPICVGLVRDALHNSWLDWFLAAVAAGGINRACSTLNDCLIGASLSELFKNRIWLDLVRLGKVGGRSRRARISKVMRSPRLVSRGKAAHAMAEERDLMCVIERPGR